MPKQKAALPRPTERAVALERERLNSLIGSMADGVIAVDDQVKVVQYNGAALNLLDMNSTIKGRLLRRLMHLYDHNGQPIDVEMLIRSTTIPTSSRDYLLHYSDGSRANIYLSIAPVRLGYGTTGDRGYVILVRDITREKSLEEERDEFISVISHELRTPIAITEGNISNVQFMVEHNADPAQIKEALRVSHEQVVFLSGLVNDLATLSRAERGVLKVEVSAINPHQLVIDLQRAYEDEAEAKGLNIETELDEHLEALHSSQLYVREILQNFITNAIKYTEEGHVTVGAHKATNGVRFTIRDTGIGISKTDQEKVFEKFFRSEDYRTRATNGTGLGLYVTMKLARLIKAEISVKSQLNHGSEFSVFIPNLS